MLLRAIQGLLWRVYQLALLIFGVIGFFELGGEQLVGTGWPTVFASWGTGFFSAYAGTIITLRIAEKANAARLNRRQGKALRDFPAASKKVRDFTHEPW